MRSGFHRLGILQFSTVQAFSASFHVNRHFPWKRAGCVSIHSSTRSFERGYLLYCSSHRRRRQRPGRTHNEKPGQKQRRAETMPKAISKVTKQIAKKRGGKKDALHEKSRDVKKIRAAAGREDKLTRHAAATLKGRQYYGMQVLQHRRPTEYLD